MFLALRNAAPRRRSHRPLTVAWGLLFAFLGTAFAIYASSGVLGANVHEVVAGKLYRSAQLSLPELDALMSSHGIASVLSLRKFDPPAPELVREFEHLEQIGVPHFNVQMSPTRLPKPEAVAALLDRFDSGPYPLLVHCEEGADRTGLAVVVWLVVVGGKSLDEARASDLSWRTGHFAIGQAHAMDDFFELYRSTADGRDLRTWIREGYPKAYRNVQEARARHEELAHGG